MVTTFSEGQRFDTGDHLVRVGKVTRLWITLVCVPSYLGYFLLAPDDLSARVATGQYKPVEDR